MGKGVIRWGMIGCGDVTEKKSAPSFNKIEGSLLKAVASRTPARAQEYARRHGIPVYYPDPYELIHDPDVDIVYVATPPASHTEYALETLAAGKPVYIEKPMARTWEECRAINRMAGEKGLPVYVAYYRRSLEYFKQVGELVSEGMPGEIRHIGLEQFFAARQEDFRGEDLPWRVIPEISGGGYFHDMGCHALDILFYIFGDPVSVEGSVSNKAGLYEAPDTITARLELAGGVSVDGKWEFASGEGAVKDRVSVEGENGVLEFSVFSFEPIEIRIGGEQQFYSTTQPEHIQMPFIRTIVNELNGRGSCPSKGESAAVTSRVMDQISGVT